MTRSFQLFPTITLTGSSLDSGIAADFKKGSISPLLIFPTKAAKLSLVISSESQLYLVCLLVKQRTLGVEDVSTPKYSANLSYSPCPSFLDETVRTKPGLVASYALKASRAPASASSSPRKRNRASLLSLKTFSMASLLKGITSAKTAVMMRATRSRIFILKLLQQLPHSQLKRTRDKYQCSSKIYKILQPFLSAETRRESTNISKIYNATLLIYTIDPISDDCNGQTIKNNQTIMQQLKGETMTITRPRKPTYFQKSRMQLEKIADQINKQNQKSSRIINITNSPKRDSGIRKSYLEKDIEDSSPTKSNIEQYTPPFFNIPPEGLMFTRTFTDSDSSPATRKISIAQISISPSPTDQSRKVSIRLNSSSDKQKQETPTYSKEEYTPIRRQSEISTQIQTMSKQQQSLKSKLDRVKQQIEQKKKLMEQIKEELSDNSENDYMKNIVQYAQRIIFLEQSIKEIKKNQEENLSTFIQEKDRIHSENNELSQKIEINDETIENIRKEYEGYQLQSPNKLLQSKSSKLQSDIARLQTENYQAELRKNNSQELQQIALEFYKRYTQIWIKRFLGKEVAKLQDSVKFKANEDKIKKQIQKKKDQLKEKKIQLVLKEKSLTESYKVMEKMSNSIKIIQEELKQLSSPQRKLTFFSSL